MPSTPSLLATLRGDFPALQFSAGEKFHWSPSEKTIYYADEADKLSLLHEVAHAALNHHDYQYDIELIKIERQAWDYVVSDLLDRYSVVIDEDFIESTIDTYRDWLHDRSLCPGCGSTGLQQAKKLYGCLACDTRWRVNEARLCALRRYRLPQK